MIALSGYSSKDYDEIPNEFTRYFSETTEGRSMRINRNSNPDGVKKARLMLLNKTVSQQAILTKGKNDKPTTRSCSVVANTIHENSLHKPLIVSTSCTGAFRSESPASSVNHRTSTTSGSFLVVP